MAQADGHAFYLEALIWAVAEKRGIPVHVVQKMAGRTNLSSSPLGRSVSCVSVGVSLGVGVGVAVGGTVSLSDVSAGLLVRGSPILPVCSGRAGVRQAKLG